MSTGSKDARRRAPVRGGAALCLLALCAGFISSARADGRPGTILVFPKIISDGAVDTGIEITHTSNMGHIMASCFYVNGAGRCSESGGLCETDASCPSPEVCTPQWTQTGFRIELTRQQPTYWIASSGRAVNFRDPPCLPQIPGDPYYGQNDCYGAGFDPGSVPGVGLAFRGELVCVLVDDSGFPLAANSLTGQATLRTLATGDVAKYNAVGLMGFQPSDPLVLRLDGSEFERCPGSWTLDHSALGATDLVAGGRSTIITRLTAVPCTQDFQTQNTVSTSVLVEVTNEFETRFSTQTTVNCWRDIRLADFGKIYDPAFLGSQFVSSRLGLNSDSESSILLVAQEFHTAGLLHTSAAMNAYAGDPLRDDIVFLPNTVSAARDR